MIITVTAGWENTKEGKTIESKTGQDRTGRDGSNKDLIAQDNGPHS